MPDPTVATVALTVVTAMVALLDVLRAGWPGMGLVVALVAEIVFLRR